MNHGQSKLPDLKEISAITRKIFQDLKKSVKEIISDYHAKRQSQTHCTSETPVDIDEDAAPPTKKAKTVKPKTTKKPGTTSKAQKKSTPKISE